MRRAPGLIITAALAFLFCGGEIQKELKAELSVVVTFLPIYLITTNVVGNVGGVVVEVLVDPEAGDLHNYQLAPRDMLTLNGADLVVVNGLGLEGFLEDALSDLPPETIIVAASEGIEPLPYRFGEEKPGGRHHGGWDPHVWTSPKGAVGITENVRDALVEADPANADAYRANAADLIGRLDAIYGEMLSAAEGWGNRVIITNHDAFGYLARDVGLEIAGVVMLTPGASPSAGEMLELVELVGTTGAAAVFVEPQYPEGPARRIAEQAGVPVYTLDPCVTGETNPGYLLEVMERNLENLDAALGG
jgi:zinc transport system substrate-binding protein